MLVVPRVRFQDCELSKFYSFLSTAPRNRGSEHCAFLPSPPVLRGRGVGGEGKKAKPQESGSVQPPHPRPLSPGVLGERGEGRQRTVRTLYSASLSSVLKMPDGIAKQLQPIAFRGQAKSRPAWMLGRQDVPLRVRHQAQDPAAGVAHTGNIALGAVWIDGVAAGLTGGSRGNEAPPARPGPGPPAPRPPGTESVLRRGQRANAGARCRAGKGICRALAWR